MSDITKDMLLAVADLHQIPNGAYNIRENGKSIDRKTTANIDIITKQDKSGIDIVIKPNTVNESVHIPVVISQSGLSELVYNDFYVGENSDVLIVAGCGIHNPSNQKSEHNGIHSFHLAKGAKVRYVEKHLGAGESGEKVLNPVTNIILDDDAELVMETTQLGGVSYSLRNTKATLKSNSKLIIKEKILTSDNQVAKSNFDVVLQGEGGSVDVISRSVAKGNSEQSFVSRVIGETRCFGHVECDAILMDNAVISATPEIVAKSVDASLVHEAAIGKIAGEQVIKLMTLGLTDKEAEDLIIKGFLN